MIASGLRLRGDLRLCSGPFADQDVGVDASSSPGPDGVDARTTRADPPTLFVMVGLPGAGKTTLAKHLEREHRALRLTPDDWMMPLFGWGESDGRREIVEALLWGMGSRALQLGLNVVLDYGLWSRAERDDYRARAHGLGARVDIRFLDAPEHELFRRIEARNASPDTHDVPITVAQMREYLSQFERPTAQEQSTWSTDLSSHG